MKILKLLKKYIGEIFIIGGTGLFIYNIFDFSYEFRIGSLSLKCVKSCIKIVCYYYSYSTLSYITIGAMLIVLGI